MTIYIDAEYKCHTAPAEEYREFDVPFFEGRCGEFIEGYRYVPDGETWTDNGVEYAGEMIAPWVDYTGLERAQYLHEISGYEAALSAIETALGVTT